MTDWPQPLLNWISRKDVSELEIEKLFWILLQFGSIQAGVRSQSVPRFLYGA